MERDLYSKLLEWKSAFNFEEDPNLKKFNRPILARTTLLNLKKENRPINIPLYAISLFPKICL